MFLRRQGKNLVTSKMFNAIYKNGSEGDGGGLSQRLCETSVEMEPFDLPSSS